MKKNDFFMAGWALNYFQDMKLLILMPFAEYFGRNYLIFNNPYSRSIDLTSCRSASVIADCKSVRSAHHH